MIEKDLPSGWIRANLENICHIERGITFPAEYKYYQPSRELIACLRTANVQEIVDWDDLIYIPKTFVKKESKFLRKNDILMSTANSRELVGKVSLVNHLPMESTLGGFISALRTASALNHKYLFYFLRMNSTLSILRKNSSQTVNIANISLGDIYSLFIPLAPLAEQERIVASLEEKITILDEAIAALRQDKAKLKKARASVLKYAVEGKLTEAWRAEHSDIEPASELLKRILAERSAKWEVDQLVKMEANGKVPKDDKWKQAYKEPMQPNVADLPSLPEGWCWVSMDQIVSRSEYGTSVKCDYDAQGVPVLRIPNIAKGEIDLNNLKYSLSQLNLNYDSSLQPGDMLVCRTNGSISLIGKAALVKKSLVPYHTFASYLLRFRFYESASLPIWVYFFFTSLQGRRFIERNAASSAGQHNISLSLIHTMVLPLPPLAEQKQIGTEVENRLFVIDQAEAAVDASLKRAERTRQSVLEQAFSGQLVPQDPNDEPASVLLKRIREERRRREEEVKAARPKKVGRKKPTNGYVPQWKKARGGKGGDVAGTSVAGTDARQDTALSDEDRAALLYAKPVTLWDV